MCEGKREGRHGGRRFGGGVCLLLENEQHNIVLQNELCQELVEERGDDGRGWRGEGKRGDIFAFIKRTNGNRGTALDCTAKVANELTLVHGVVGKGRSEKLQSHILAECPLDRGNKVVVAGEKLQQWSPELAVGVPAKTDLGRVPAVTKISQEG